MNNKVIFNLPDKDNWKTADMKKFIINEFATYLQGDNGRKRFYEPFQPVGSDKWQIDDSNEFWLRINIKTGEVRLDCRYPESQLAIILAMVNLFKARHIERYKNP